MNNKVLRIALLSLFAKDTINNILDVVSATPNPELATEIILGLYEEPEFYKSAIKLKLSSGDPIEAVFDKYDKWEDRVHYTYMKQKIKNICINKDTDVSVITAENYKEFVDNGAIEYKYHNVVFDEMEKCEARCSLDTWLRSQNNPDNYALSV